MSISEMLVKAVGIFLVLFGAFLLVTNAAGLPATWIVVLVGLALLGLGIYLIRGGSITL